MKDVPSILIVGAGLAGAAAALALGRRGFDVCIVEQRLADDDDYGAGILLTGNGTRALASLGLSETLQDSARAVSRVDFASAGDDRLFSVDCQRPGWPAFVTIRHSRLRRLILSAATAVPRTGVSVRSIRRGGRIGVDFSDGTGAEFDLIIGADGVNSRMRDLLFGASPPERIGDFRGFRFVTSCPDALDQPRYQIGNGATLLLHPLPNGELYVGAGPIGREQETGAECGLEVLRDAYAAFSGLAREVIDSIGQSTRFIPTQYWQVRRDRWYAGRCLLVGDAAHACAPTLAQGAAMAFEDAIVLTQALSEEATVDRAIEAFAIRRHARVQRVQAASHRRMYANQPSDSRVRRLHDVSAHAFGERALTSVWGGLIDELP